MLIIADTGPLITLIQLEHLNILEKLFPDYVVPEIVYEELSRYNPIKKFEQEFFRIKNHIRMPDKLLPKIRGLDDGELACISLYYELSADALLIEDHDARLWAENNGIACFGSIGLLIKGKRRGLINEIKPLLQEMIKNKRYISKELLYKTLKDEGEINE